MLEGIYDLTITTCADAGEYAVQGWTLSQAGTEVTGKAAGSLPGLPVTWVGDMTATTIDGGKLRITQLTYNLQTSHGGGDRLIAHGVGVAASYGISGTLEGDFATAPGFGGDVKTCHGAEMPFRFARRN